MQVKPETLILITFAQTSVYAFKSASCRKAQAKGS
jgi:hypothetical protein